MALYDRGLISDETLYEALEKDRDIERERLISEREWEDEEDFERRGPFIKVPEDRLIEEDRLKEDKKLNSKDLEMRDKEFNLNKNLENKKIDNDIALKDFEVRETVKVKKELMRKNNSPSGKPNPKPNGRPPGSKAPQVNKRKSKPKNMARVDVENIVNILDENAKNYLVTKAGVSDFRGLSKEDKAKVMDLVAVSLAELDEQGLDNVINPSFMSSELSTKNIEFITLWETKAKEFYVERKRKPTKEEIYQLFVDSYMES
jgi:hypothetical protein